MRRHEATGVLFVAPQRIHDEDVLHRRVDLQLLLARIDLAQRADPLKLAALHVMTTLTGSALLALGVEAGEFTPEEGWSAAHVDEDWQIEHWGQDAEAVARRGQRERDFMACVALLQALKEVSL